VTSSEAQHTTSTPKPRLSVRVRPLVEADLPEADRILRLAFGTFLRVPDPAAFMGDANFALTRWRADPSGVFAAEHDGKLIGSNFATNWGSFGFFGPLTIHPEYWDRGVAQQLMPPVMEFFERWGCRHRGLFTFATSAKHISLYQKFGFWPRDLVASLVKEIGETSNAAENRDFTLFSGASEAERESLYAACREVTSANFEGLDATREIRAVAEQRLGDTVLVWNGSHLAGLAVCHIGAGSEAGSGGCYAKFAAVRPDASHRFSQLLDGVESLARSRGVAKINTGVNVARREAFNKLRELGFRVEMLGVSMETGSASSGYNRAGVYILDDWR
jgi:GNAT superfamily N-acetyltransferase